MKRRVKKFKPGGIYCLSGNASANSLFFEDKTDQKLFINLLDRFLGDIIEVHAFSTNPTAWSLFFAIRDETAIKNAFKNLKKRSKKAKKPRRIIEVGSMVSEHFRYFLSSYVKQSNFRHNRHGSRVHSKMEKYVFESVDDMKLEMNKMKAMEETKIQKPKYRPDMRYYLVEKQMKRQSVWRQSFVGIDGEKLVQAVLPCFRWILDKLDVLRQLITDTWTMHFGPENPQNPHPKLE